MHAIIEVLPFTDTLPVSFQALQLFHAGCTQKGQMQKQRSVADSSYTIQCGCGFKLTLPHNSEAGHLLTKTAIDEQGGTMLTGTFVSEYKGSVEVRARAAR